jgi:tetratricopeptide (TPR) repeat protein
MILEPGVPRGRRFTMTRPIVLLALVLAALPASAGEEPDASVLFDQGNRKLSEGDFAAAARAYAGAARADPENDEYARRALILSRVVSLRRFLAENEPSEKWERVAASLHGFYLRHGLAAVAVTEDRKVHEKAKSPLTAALLAEALLETGGAEAAETVLLAVPESDRNAHHHAFLAIAKARLGKAEAAAGSLATASLAEDAGPGLLFNRARALALLGNAPEALALLVRCLEGTPPGSVAEMREGIRGCADFAKLPEDALAKALSTESKVPESGCSGGAGCGSCPSRGGCGK